MFQIYWSWVFFFFFVFLLCWIQVADQYWEPLDVKIHMLILLVPLILINYIRNLKLLAPFSTLANVITFVGLTMILVYMFKDLPSPKEREMFGTLRNFSLYFGTTLFALEAVGVVSLISFLLFVSLLCFYRLSYNKLVCYLERQLWFIETTKSIEMARKWQFQSISIIRLLKFHLVHLQLLKTGIYYERNLFNSIYLFEIIFNNNTE